MTYYDDPKIMFSNSALSMAKFVGKSTLLDYFLN